ncbi:MAG: hypothetical protein UV53_C0002G0035 [Candidatus Azambacteria bacterium GW2011_GWE1_42_9]|nr:MAG: hypothetical protein UU33_C0001G0082 [Candidatus Azambacteria bacterium GW2011_GWF1_41_10]KKS49145.1 MAG: hypothetical protein UV14_C0002G0142 [Candidatus Azambacteria bacterium GW2011_GWF2_42_22]KKS79729.1 MAG: hypothetical protein UV53_C0002G0035 [Candidatus Azambacteria bacterium GW2011_GWE1_42_9]KKT03276.1 MAG: hypothetical protein UV81_C0002G0029 [Candidatus Azambacteria bacterium GW2011_GWD1_43_18]KKT12647.1 MAG: hypothetical protein UV93_C0002G0045 [Candidatus Azambacteria bacter
MAKILIKTVKTDKELADAKSVRIEVFQKEQRIAKELDFDNKDNEADHVIAYFDKKPVGTMRIRYVDNDKIVKIERMAVLQEFRSQNIGGRMMEYALDAQDHARKFYEKLGFKQEGEVFMEVGIPHIKMFMDLIS